MRGPERVESTRTGAPSGPSTRSGRRRRSSARSSSHDGRRARARRTRPRCPGSPRGPAARRSARGPTCSVTAGSSASTWPNGRPCSPALLGGALDRLVGGRPRPSARPSSVDTRSASISPPVSVEVGAHPLGVDLEPLQAVAQPRRRRAGGQPAARAAAPTRRARRPRRARARGPSTASSAPARPGAARARGQRGDRGDGVALVGHRRGAAAAWPPARAPRRPRSG